MAAPQENNNHAAAPAPPPLPPLPPPLPLRRQPLLYQLPRRLEHEISRIDGRIRELEDECYRLVSEGHGSLMIRFRIEKMEALRAKLISGYLQQQQKEDGGDGDGGDVPPPPPAAGGAAAVN
uniref:Uncharacterized protein n=1 Tax=Oryza punctata TaxID=4537 RepID=A0A0E0LSJ0_ORYPU